jgi:hypothetical protein
MVSHDEFWLDYDVEGPNDYEEEDSLGNIEEDD